MKRAIGGRGWTEWLASAGDGLVGAVGAISSTVGPQVSYTGPLEKHLTGGLRYPAQTTPGRKRLSGGIDMQVPAPFSHVAAGPVAGLCGLHNA